MRKQGSLVPHGENSTQRTVNEMAIRNAAKASTEIV
jgi:hypothetical protein